MRKVPWSSKVEEVARLFSAYLSSCMEKRKHHADQGRRIQLGADDDRRATRRRPPLLIYVFLMDYYIAGLTAGATKG